MRTLALFPGLLAILAASALAGPIVDGRFDPSEGYTAGYYLDLTVEKAGVVPNAGQLWTYQDPGSQDVFAALVFDRSLVDNTYGANSIGWGSQAPSGKNHNFGDLVGSDKAQFRFKDGSDNVVLDFELDYLSSSGGGYQSLGASGGDGKMHVGSASKILNYGTSLDYNFNSLGYQLTTDSPATDDNYTENPSYPGWEFSVVYEVQVDGSLFGNGFGGVSVPIAHVSPNKIGRNKVWTTPSGPICQPAAIGDLVWIDENGNGIQDAGEVGLDDVVVSLYDQNDLLIATMATAGGGEYVFENLSPGTYYLDFTAPNGYQFTQQDAGSDDAKDSDANPATGRTAWITLASGQSDLTWDAGLQPTTPVIPEPSSLAVLGMGVVALVRLRSRRSGGKRRARTTPGPTNAAA